MTLTRASFYASAVVLAGALVFANQVATTAFVSVSDISGWTLLAMIVALATVGVRRRSSGGSGIGRFNRLQFHIVTGTGAILVFWLHAGLSWPGGLVERSLTAGFWGVALSGVAGLLLVRRSSQLLAGRTTEVTFDGITDQMLLVRERAEQIVESACDEANVRSAALVELYANLVQPFLAKPNNTRAHLFHLTYARRRVLAAFEQYAADHSHELKGRTPATSPDAATALRQCVLDKDELDYCYAQLAARNAWLYLHVPASLFLIVMAVLHGLLVTAFRS